MSLLTHSSLPHSSDRFPLKAVLLTALAPALVGLFCGLFVSPPTIHYDTAVGLAAWANYTDGGTWNTVSRADPSNIANAIEQSVTWWPPGQYIPVGLLQLTGLSLGKAASIVAFLSTLSFGIGGAALAKVSGAKPRTLPWVAGGLACSCYTLGNFNVFNGGETGLMLCSLWITLLAWRLRNRPILLIFFLPFLFLLGSFFKHAFAIQAISVISFLTAETLRGNYIYNKSSGGGGGGFIRTISPLVFIFTSGLIYILLRNHYIDFSNSPISSLGGGSLRYSIATYWGYSAWAPLLSIIEIEYYLNRFFNFEGLRVWEYLQLPLTATSPIAIGLYTWLSFRRNLLMRLAGLSSLIYFGLHFIIYSNGGTIELRSRYYAYPAFLLLSAAATQICNSDWKRAASKSILVSSILIGLISTIKTSFAMKAFLSLNNSIGVTTLVPHIAMEKLRTLSENGEDTIIALPLPILEAELRAIKHPSTRLISMYSQEYPYATEFHGRASIITIFYHKNWNNHDNPYANSFIDYSDEEWDSYEIGDWIFLQARSSNESAEGPNTSAAETL